MAPANASRVTPAVLFVRKRVYMGCEILLACDGKCDKAWGVSCRPKEQLGEDPDDVVFLADGELGTAPADPGTYEGGYGKPASPEQTNRWCSRECERASLTEAGHGLKVRTTDWSQRVYNQPHKNCQDNYELLHTEALPPAANSDSA